MPTFNNWKKKKKKKIDFFFVTNSPTLTLFRDFQAVVGFLQFILASLEVFAELLLLYLNLQLKWNWKKKTRNYRMFFFLEIS